MRTSPLTLAALLLAPAFGGMAPLAQPAGPYTEWKPSQARRILERSPWVANLNWVHRPDSGTAERVEDLGHSQAVTLRLRLFSAPPIRQAHAVLAAQGDPDRLTNWQAFATRSFTNEIVISCEIIGRPPSGPVLDLLRTRLATMQLAEIRADTFLVTDMGRKVFLKDYTPPTADGTGAKFIFPRHLPDGTDLVQAGDRRLSFHSAPLPLVSDALPGHLRRPCAGRLPSTMQEYLTSTRSSRVDALTVQASFALDKCRVDGEPRF